MNLMGIPWAQQMIGLLLEGNQAVEHAKKTEKNASEKCAVCRIISRYEAIITFGMKANPPPIRREGCSRRGRLKRSKARNLLERLAERKRDPALLVRF